MFEKIVHQISDFDGTHRFVVGGIPQKINDYHSLAYYKNEETGKVYIAATQYFFNTDFPVETVLEIIELDKSEIAEKF